MTRGNLVIVALALACGAAAPLPDPVRDSIVADAKSQPPTALAFERTTKSVRTGGGSTTSTVKVERWDGKRWALVQLNGRKPTAGQLHEARKLAAAAPVPGYHRLAALLGAATESVTDAQGRTVLKIPKLPRGSVMADAKDISSHLKAELTVSNRGGQPWIERVKVTQREPFMMNMLIRVLTFEQVSEYRLDSDGKPRLASQTADSMGSMFGFPGGETSQATYVYR